MPSAEAAAERCATQGERGKEVVCWPRTDFGSTTLVRRRKAMRAAQEAGLSAAAVADAKHTGGKDVKAEGACLVRATDGDKKISVRVGAAEYKAFQRTVAALMREQTTALKKRDRTKEKAAAKKKAKSSK